MSWDILLADGSVVTVNDEKIIEDVHKALKGMSVANMGRTIPVLDADQRGWDIVVSHIVAIRA
jgi:hypothetical protein